MTQVPVLEAILHPPLGLLQRSIIPGTFTGAGDLTRATGAPPPFNHVNAYGLTWDFFTVPAGYGRELGEPDVFDRRMLQVSTVHTDVSAHDTTSEWHEFRVEGVYWLWANPGPTRVHYDIAPGVEVVFFWLLI